MAPAPGRVRPPALPWARGPRRRTKSAAPTPPAAMLAGVPLALGHGTGSELRQPLGYAMVGGLALSQILTLYTTPVVYLYLDRINTWIKGGRADHDHAPMEGSGE